MYWPNLKSVAFPTPEIIGGTRKKWAVPGYAHAPFSPKNLMGFCSMIPSCMDCRKAEVRCVPARNRRQLSVPRLDASCTVAVEESL